MSGAIEYINSFKTFGKAPGLHRIGKLLELVGNPQKELSFIHIAGTNGKGSVSAYISNILQCAALKTGLFISPYIIDFRERFQINGEMISEADLEYYTGRVRTATSKLPKEDMPTQFDLITAIAFLYFKEKACDVVVLETGLGGLYDSTNIIEDPLCTVITSISKDHTALLGDTIEEIALQKAGILKPDCNSVLYPIQDPNAKKVIEKTANKLNSQLTVPDLQDLTVTDLGLLGSRVSYKGLEFSLRLCGSFQPYNAITAIEAVKSSGLCVSDTNIIEGLQKTVFPARCEVISTNPPLLLDGAHNPDSMKLLAEFINKHLPRPITAVIGMMADKDITSTLAKIAPCFSEIFCVQPKNPRAVTADKLAEIGADYTKCTPCNSLEDALEKAKETGASVVVCGSLYLASEAKRILCEEKI